MNKKVNLITNGMLIDDVWVKHLVEGLDWIQVSVNAATKRTHELVNQGSRYETVVGNLKKLIRVKTEVNSHTKIVFKFTATRENLHEIADAIQLAEDLGCDSIAFGFDDTVKPSLNNQPELREKLKNKISTALGKVSKVEVDKNRLEYLNLI